MKDPEAIGMELTGGSRFRGVIGSAPAPCFRAAIKTSFSEQIICRWHSVTRRPFNPVGRNLRRPIQLSAMWPPLGSAQFNEARFYTVLAAIQLNVVLGPINKMFSDKRRIDSASLLTQSMRMRKYYSRFRSAGEPPQPEPTQPPGTTLRFVTGNNVSARSIELSRTVTNTERPTAIPEAFTNIIEFSQRWRESLKVIASLARIYPQAGAIRTQIFPLPIRTLLNSLVHASQTQIFASPIRTSLSPRVDASPTQMFAVPIRTWLNSLVHASQTQIFASPIRTFSPWVDASPTQMFAVPIRTWLNSLVHASHALRLADITMRLWARPLQSASVFRKTGLSTERLVSRPVNFERSQQTSAWRAQPARSRGRSTRELKDSIHSGLEIAPWRGLALTTSLAAAVEPGDHAPRGIRGKQPISWQRMPQLSLVTGPVAAGATTLFEATFKNENHVHRRPAFGDSAIVYHTRGESKLLQELVKTVRDLPRSQPELKPTAPFVMPEIEQITRQVSHQLEREIKIERERRGL